MLIFELLWIILGVILLVGGYIPLNYLDGLFLIYFDRTPKWFNIRPLYVRLIGAAIILINIRPFLGLFNMIKEMIPS